MNEQIQIDLPARKHLSHIPPVRVSQYAVGAPYFITICADRMHYGLVGRVIPNTPNSPSVGRLVPKPPKSTAPIGGGIGICRPTNSHVVGRVIPNAPSAPAPNGGIRICRPTNPSMVGRVIPNTPNPAPNDGGLRTNRPTTPIPAPLTAANNAVKLLFALDFYRAKGIILPRLAVVMPDHIHFIASFSKSADMAKSIRNWKRWTAKDTGIVWQDEFFDYRLRNEAEITEKMQYVAMNPVRKGLCESPDDWPFRMTWR